MDTKLNTLIGGALLSVTTLVAPQIAQAQVYGRDTALNMGYMGMG